MNLPALNLPQFEFRMRNHKGVSEIFDVIRKKFVVLTPEEWVRQHFIHLLIDHLNYPPGLFQIERQHSYYGLFKRSDILVFDQELKPVLLVECKAPHISLDRTATTQMATYHQTIRSKYSAITNGMQHFIWEWTNNDFKSINQFPDYNSIKHER